MIVAKFCFTGVSASLFIVKSAARSKQMLTKETSPLTLWSSHILVCLFRQQRSSWSKMEKNLPKKELGLQTHLNIHSVAWVMLSRRHVIIIRFLQDPAVREKQLARTWPAEFATATPCCRPVLSWSSFEAKHGLSPLMSIKFWGKHLLKHLYDRIWYLSMIQSSKERRKSKEGKAMGFTLSDLQIKFKASN